MSMTSIEYDDAQNEPLATSVERASYTLCHAGPAAPCPSATHVRCRSNVRWRKHHGTSSICRYRRHMPWRPGVRRSARRAICFRLPCSSGGHQSARSTAILGPRSARPPASGGGRAANQRGTARASLRIGNASDGPRPPRDRSPSPRVPVANGLSSGRLEGHRRSLRPARRINGDAR